MALAIEVAERLERADLGVLGDLRVPRAQDDVSFAESHLDELAARLEIAFGTEVLTYFAALSHDASVARSLRGGQVFWPALRASARVRVRAERAREVIQESARGVVLSRAFGEQRVNAEWFRGVAIQHLA